MTKPLVSVAIITKNEEKNIRECIESVKGWAYEIIIVDGFSEDSTVAVAEALGARVIQHTWEGDFSIERNKGIEAAKGDWVLHLDADDRVTDNFKKCTDEILASSDGFDVFKFRRRSYFLGHCMVNGGWYHAIPNLVRRAGVRFEGRLHERPVYSGKLGEIDADVEHHPFSTISQFVDRHNRYSSMQAGRMKDEFGCSKLGAVRQRAIGKSFKIFWKSYVKKKGFGEGMHGLVFSVLFAFMNFLVWIKYWELCSAEKSLKEGKG